MIHLYSIPLAGGSIVDLDKTVLIQLVIFLVTFFLLRSLLFKPVIRLIEARRTATVGARESASEANEEFIRLETDFDAKIAEVRGIATTERTKMIEQARAKGREIVDKARDASHKQSVKAHADAEQMTDQVLADLKKDVSSMAMQTASAVLGREVGERV